ncbi:hypothetical protein [Azospirillum sp. ST 5-10]|uniref:hypothetical protein n=1 Tax=unclassified Azospirillum TaxID=2630922 RepID=UPI003F4A82B9
MNVEDRKDLIAQMPGHDAECGAETPVGSRKNTESIDEDYHFAAALAHRPSAH